MKKIDQVVHPDRVQAGIRSSVPLAAPGPSGFFQSGAELLRIRTRRTGGREGRGGPSGLTLVELIVVIAIIAVLALLAFVVGKGAVRSARGAKTLGNMRQLTGAMLGFTSDHNGMMPSALQSNGTYEFSWDLQILPNLGIEDGYTGTPANPKLRLGLNLDVFRCALDSRKTASGAAYPRSFGITPSAIYMYAGPGRTEWSGGLPNGKTPYGFADGHAALLTQEEAKKVDPLTWSVNK